MSRTNTKPCTPIAGCIYTQHSGGRILCVAGARQPNCKEAVMINVFTGWTFHAHNIRQYPDGSLEWDYSTGGKFAWE